MSFPARYNDLRRTHDSHGVHPGSVHGREYGDDGGGEGGEYTDRDGEI